MIAFDKTGTLTEDSLRLAGFIENKDTGLNDNLKQNINEASEIILLSLSTCHSVKMIDNILAGFFFMISLSTKK